MVTVSSPVKMRFLLVFCILLFHKSDPTSGEGDARRSRSNTRSSADRFLDEFLSDIGEGAGSQSGTHTLNRGTPRIIKVSKPKRRQLGNSELLASVASELADYDSYDYNYDEEEKAGGDAVVDDGVEDDNAAASNPGEPGVREISRGKVRRRPLGAKVPSFDNVDLDEVPVAGLRGYYLKNRGGYDFSQLGNGSISIEDSLKDPTRGQGRQRPRQGRQRPIGRDELLFDGELDEVSRQTRQDDGDSRVTEGFVEGCKTTGYESRTREDCQTVIDTVCKTLQVTKYRTEIEQQCRTKLDQKCKPIETNVPKQECKQKMVNRCVTDYEIVEDQSYTEECHEHIQHVCEKHVEVPVAVEVPYPVKVPYPHKEKEYHHPKPPLDDYGPPPVDEYGPPPPPPLPVHPSPTPHPIPLAHPTPHDHHHHAPAGHHHHSTPVPITVGPTPHPHHPHHPLHEQGHGVPPPLQPRHLVADYPTPLPVTTAATTLGYAVPSTTPSPLYNIYVSTTPKVAVAGHPVQPGPIYDGDIKSKLDYLIAANSHPAVPSFNNNQNKYSPRSHYHHQTTSAPHISTVKSLPLDPVRSALLQEFNRQVRELEATRAKSEPLLGRKKRESKAESSANAEPVGSASPSPVAKGAPDAEPGPKAEADPKANADADPQVSSTFGFGGGRGGFGSGGRNGFGSLMTGVPTGRPGILGLLMDDNLADTAVQAARREQQNRLGGILQLSRTGGDLDNFRGERKPALGGGFRFPQLSTTEEKEVRREEMIAELTKNPVLLEALGILKSKEMRDKMKESAEDSEKDEKEKLKEMMMKKLLEELMPAVATGTATISDLADSSNKLREEGKVVGSVLLPAIGGFLEPFHNKDGAVHEAGVNPLFADDHLVPLNEYAEPHPHPDHHHDHPHDHEPYVKEHIQELPAPPGCRSVSIHKCHKVPIVVPKKVPVEKCEEVPVVECFSVLKTVPDLECSPTSYQDCNDYVKEVPYLSPEENCEDVPYEECVEIEEEVPVEVCVSVDTNRRPISTNVGTSYRTGKRPTGTRPTTGRGAGGLSVGAGRIATAAFPRFGRSSGSGENSTGIEAERRDNVNKLRTISLADDSLFLDSERHLRDAQKFNRRSEIDNNLAFFPE